MIKGLLATLANLMSIVLISYCAVAIGAMFFFVNSFAGPAFVALVLAHAFLMFALMGRFAYLHYSERMEEQEHIRLMRKLRGMR